MWMRLQYWAQIMRDTIIDWLWQCVFISCCVSVSDVLITAFPARMYQLSLSLSISVPVSLCTSLPCCRCHCVSVWAFWMCSFWAVPLTSYSLDDHLKFFLMFFSFVPSSNVACFNAFLIFPGQTSFVLKSNFFPLFAFEEEEGDEILHADSSIS